MYATCCEPFERSARFYDVMYAGRDYDTLAHRYWSALGVMSNAGIVVEFGCGTGEMSVRLGKMGVRIWGVDPNPWMLQIAAAKGVTALAGDMESSALVRQTEGVIAPYAVFAYATADARPAEILAKLAADMSRGTNFVFDVPSKEFAREKYGDTVSKSWPVDGLTLKRSVSKTLRPDGVAEILLEFELGDERWTELHHMRTFTKFELENALRIRGFDVVTIEPLTADSSDWFVVARRR